MIASTNYEAVVGERRRSMAGGEQRWQRQCEPRRTAASNDMAVRAVDCLRTSTTCRKPLGDGLLERELPHWTHTCQGLSSGPMHPLPLLRAPGQWVPCFIDRIRRSHQPLLNTKLIRVCITLPIKSLIPIFDLLQ